VACELLPDVLRIMRRLLLLVDVRPQDFTFCFKRRSKEHDIEVTLEDRSNDQP
jgi:hypothetical protein